MGAMYCASWLCLIVGHYLCVSIPRGGRSRQSRRPGQAGSSWRGSARGAGLVSRVARARRLSWRRRNRWAARCQSRAAPWAPALAVVRVGVLAHGRERRRKLEGDLVVGNASGGRLDREVDELAHRSELRLVMLQGVQAVDGKPLWMMCVKLPTGWL